jgi:hypothetical protein
VFVDKAAPAVSIAAPTDPTSVLKYGKTLL